MHPEETTFVETADHLSIEQEIDDVKNKHRESDQDDSHEVASPHTVSENQSSPPPEVEPSKEIPSLAIQESKEKNSPFQTESNRNGVESPASDDRNLEQFSEVLLDSDSSLSDHEAGADDIPDSKKDGKRVRFADEVGTSGADEGINNITGRMHCASFLYMQNYVMFRQSYAYISVMVCE